MEETVLLNVKDNPPPKNGRVFLTYNQNQGGLYLICWYDTVMKTHWRVSGGSFYGTTDNPQFTHRCKLPTITNE